MIKRNPSLTDQVKAHIKQLIFDNTYEDDRVPSETDLADELGVSRTTVRDALSRLENEGIVIRKQGAGTFINQPGLQVRSRLDEIWSYQEALQAHGYEPATRILEVSEAPAKAQQIRELNLSSTDKVLTVKKLFLEDKQPVILAINLIPLHLITRPYSKEDLIEPVFEFLAKYGGHHLSYFLSEIVPIVGINDISANLRISSGTPLISLEEIGYSEENEPILKANSYFRDDLLRLGLIRRKV
jgi:GntR family transcriptional regulator